MSEQTTDMAAASYALGIHAFHNGEQPPPPVAGEYRDDHMMRLTGYIDALADTVRDLAVAVSLMMGDGNADVDVGALRERLSQIRPRQER